MMIKNSRSNKTDAARKSTRSYFLKQALNTVAAAVAVTTVMATPASATVYRFTSTDIPGFGPSPTTSSFSLDTATATVIPNGSQFNNVNITYDGVAYPNSLISALFGVNLASPLFFFIDTDIRPFFTGAGVGTVFNTGTFRIADGFTDGEGTLSISSSVPEAATWSMMLTGFGAMGFKIRRRRHRLARA